MNFISVCTVGLCLFIWQEASRPTRLNKLLLLLLLRRRVGSVVSVFAFHTVGRGFASRPCHTKDHHKMAQTASLNRHACVGVGA